MNERGNFRAYSLNRKKNISLKQSLLRIKKYFEKVFDQFGLCILTRVWGREINVLKATSKKTRQKDKNNLTAKYTAFADLGDYHTRIGVGQKNSRTKNFTTRRTQWPNKKKS